MTLLSFPVCLAKIGKLHFQGEVINILLFASGFFFLLFSDWCVSDTVRRNGNIWRFWSSLCVFGNINKFIIIVKYFFGFFQGSLDDILATLHDVWSPVYPSKSLVYPLKSKGLSGSVVFSCLGLFDSLRQNNLEVKDDYWTTPMNLKGKATFSPSNSLTYPLNIKRAEWGCVECNYIVVARQSEANRQFWSQRRFVNDAPMNLMFSGNSPQPPPLSRTSTCPWLGRTRRWPLLEVIVSATARPWNMLPTTVFFVHTNPYTIKIQYISA